MENLQAGEVHRAALGFAEIGGKAYLTQGSYEAAGYLVVAERKAEKGEIKEALAACRESLKRTPEDPDARFKIGYCLGLWGDHQGAFNEFDRTAGARGVDRRTKIRSILTSEAPPPTDKPCMGNSE